MDKIMTLTKYIKQRIREYDKQGLNHVQIASKVGVSKKTIEMYLYKFITNKVYNGKKRCSKCGILKKEDINNFSPSNYIKQDGSRGFYRECKECRNKIRRTEEYRQKPYVLIRNKIRGYKKRVEIILLGCNKYRLTRTDEQKKELARKKAIASKKRKLEKLNLIIKQKREGVI